MIRRAVRAAVRGIAFLVGLEVVAWLAFTLILRDHMPVQWQLDSTAAVAAVDEASIATFREQFYDPLLGWVFKPETTAVPYTAFDARGARRDPRAASGRVVAYGDSFTFGEGVGDTETWPHRLGALLGDGVANFGVTGFGPDQAFLRLRRDIETFGAPDVVILGVPSENIARVVNAWRYLYTGADMLRFKPMLDVGAGRWLPNPLAVLGGPESIAAAAATAASAPDYWRLFNDSRPAPEFPYLWAAADTADYLLMRARRWQDLWSEPRAVATLDAIVDELVSLARVYGFRPVLLMIPMPTDLRLDESGRPATYAAFAAETAATYGDRLIVIDPLARDFDRARFNERPYLGNASAYGNQVLAEATFSALRSSP